MGEGGRGAIALTRAELSPRGEGGRFNPGASWQHGSRYRIARHRPHEAAFLSERVLEEHGVLVEDGLLHSGERERLGLRERGVSRVLRADRVQHFTVLKEKLLHLRLRSGDLNPEGGANALLVVQKLGINALLDTGARFAE